MNEKKPGHKTTKSPFLAAILSIVFPGTGALYNGDYLRGIIFIIIFAGLVTMQTRSHVQPFAALILVGFYFFQIIDAVHRANQINLAAQGVEKVEPEAFRTVRTEAGGSIFWGLFLVGLGIVLLLANYDIILYERLFDFWPLLIVIIGLKLIIDALQKK